MSPSIDASSISCNTRMVSVVVVSSPSYARAVVGVITLPPVSASMSMGAEFSDMSAFSGTYNRRY